MSTGRSAGRPRRDVELGECGIVRGGDELLLRGEELVLLDQHVEHSAGAGQRLLPKAGQRDLSTMGPSPVGPAAPCRCHGRTPAGAI